MKTILVLMILLLIAGPVNGNCWDESGMMQNRGWMQQGEKYEMAVPARLPPIVVCIFSCDEGYVL